MCPETQRETPQEHVRNALAILRACGHDTGDGGASLYDTEDIEAVVNRLQLAIAALESEPVAGEPVHDPNCPRRCYNPAF